MIVVWLTRHHCMSVIKVIISTSHEPNIEATSIAVQIFVVVMLDIKRTFWNYTYLLYKNNFFFSSMANIIDS